MRWQDHIVATPDTLHGSPRFRGTRIPVSVVLDNLAAGATAAELHAEYPTLPKEAVPAALAYAAELARDQIVPITAQLVPAVKLDENVPDSVGAVLREGGHDVAFAQDEHLIRHMAKTLSGLLADERLRGRLWVLDESRLRIWPHAGPA